MKSKPFIVVGVDGSDASIEALRWAIIQARQFQSKLQVVSAYDIPLSIISDFTRTEADYEQIAENNLEKCMDAVRSEIMDVDFETRVLLGKPGFALEQAADGASLLVVGSHGYGPLPGIHLGSVANYLANHSPVPVLIHRMEK